MLNVRLFEPNNIGLLALSYVAYTKVKCGEEV